VPKCIPRHSKGICFVAAKFKVIAVYWAINVKEARCAKKHLATLLATKLHVGLANPLGMFAIFRPWH
jgi:hypothetical protein